MSNTSALNEFLVANPTVAPLLAELARTLAAELDSGPEVGLAAVAKEYRAVVDRLLTGDADAADPADEWLRSLSSPLGDTPEP